MPANTQPTNVEKFNSMIRRSSSRLRGGSVPPLESEQTVNPLQGTDQSSPTVPTAAQKGRGRGRGSQSTRRSTRPPTQGPTQEGTPAVTLTVPEGDRQANSTAESRAELQSETGIVPTSSNAPATNSISAHTGTTTTVIHPQGASNTDLTGLISKDIVEVNSDTNGKSEKQLIHPPSVLPQLRRSFFHENSVMPQAM